MITPAPDRRSPQRQKQDEQIASEPPLAPLALPPDKTPLSIEAHLGRQRRSLPAARITTRMGPTLLAEVERQLLVDLAHYGVSQRSLKIDWSDACGEGHCTHYLDGNLLEDLSGLWVIGPQGEALAEGWLDFVHGGEDLPLFVFWLFLRICFNGEWKEVKSEPVIPQHVWDRLPDQSKTACTKEGAYDARWSTDPKVRKWKLRLTP